MELNLPSTDQRPVVTIQTPPGDTVTAARASVIFTFSDDFSLNPASFTYSVVGGGFVAAPVWQWNKQSTSAFAEAEVNLAPGANTLQAQVCDQGGRCGLALASIYYKAPPPPQSPRVDPAINASVHRVDSRNLATCDGCAETVMTYSLPAYVSGDQARTVTLFYSTHQANPRGFVDIEVTDAGSDPAAYMTLQVQKPGGALVTLDNGTTTQHYRTGAGANRLAASWPAADVGTGMYNYKLIVRAHWPNEVRESRATVLVPIINAQHTLYGTGVSVAGQEQVFPRADGAMIYDGAGGIQWFAKTGCTAQNVCSYRSPTDDPSRLEYANGIWDRYYPDGSFTQYWRTGLINYRRDRFGQRTTYHYDSSLTRLEGISDPADLRTNLIYYPGNFLQSITDPFGRQAYMAYDGTRWAGVWGPDGARALEIAYDASHRLTSWYDARRGLTTVTYDPASGKMSRMEGPAITDGATTGRPTLLVRSREAALLPLAGTGTAAVPARRVTPDSVRVAVTSPLGEVTRVAVDPFGGATRIEAPRDTVIVGRNARGQVTAVSDGKANSAAYGYQAAFPYRLSAVTSQGPDGPSSYALGYGIFGEVSEVTVNWDQLRPGPTYEFVLDSLGRAVTIKRDRVVVGTATYDGPRVLTRTDAGGHTTTYSYSPGNLRNLAAVTAGGATTELRYDGLGRVVQTVTAGTESDTVGYDLLNRVTYGRDREGGVTRTSYAGNGVDLGELTDPLNQRYAWVRNALGQVTQQTDPAGLSTGYTYFSSTGLLKTRTDRRGQTVAFTYDAEGRPSTRTADGATTTWSYDPDRRWASAETPASRDTVRYDTDGKVAESVTWRDGRRFSIRHTYTDRNQPDSVVVAGPWGTRSYVYTRDGYGRLDGLRDYAGHWTQMYLNAEGLPDSVRLPTAGHMRLSFAFTDKHQLLATDARGAAPLSHRYDYIGRGLLAADTIGTAATRHGNDYEYDALDRIGAWDYNQYTRELSCPVGRECQFVVRRQTLQQQAFSWDSVGNPKGAPLAAGNRLRAYLGYSMDYDADGNLVRKYNASGFDQALTWNALGQLTGVTRTGASAVTYAYDGYGRRVKRTDAGTGAVTHFIYDGDDLALEVDGSGNLLREYTYYPGIDQPHGMRQWAGGAGGASYYYVLQQPGHVNGLVNLNDQLVNEYRYMPFGSPVSGFPVQGTPNPLQYMARELDAATGMYYVRNRWYDPQQGRFVSEDPIGLAGGINPYAYVDNAPTMKLDPMGLASCYSWSWTVWLGGGGWPLVHNNSGTKTVCDYTHDWMIFAASLPPTFRTDGGHPVGGGDGGGLKARMPDEPEIDTCLVKGALAVANLAADAVGVGLLMDAGGAFLRYAPKLGKGFAFDMVAGNIGHAFVWGGLAPVSLNVGGATVTADGSFDGLDLALFVGGFVPVIGSGIAVGDALVTCADVLL